MYIMKQIAFYTLYALKKWSKYLFTIFTDLRHVLEFGSSPVLLSDQSQKMYL